MSSALTKDQILAVDDRRMTSMHVEEWSGDVWFRVITSAERDAFEMQFAQDDKRATENIRARLLVITLCNENGERIFDAENDIEALGAKSGRVLDKLFDMAREVNGMTDDAVKDAEGN